MTRYEHRLDLIRAYIGGYLKGDAPPQVVRALEHIRDLAEGVDVADLSAKRTS